MKSKQDPDDDRDIAIADRMIAAVQKIDPKDVAIVLKAFEDGVFVRDTGRDSEPGWAMRLVAPLAALGRLHAATHDTQIHP